MLDQQRFLPPTKLHPPHIGKDVLIRERLLSTLNEAIYTHTLTLISAPAGAGKTTLLASWIQHFNSGGHTAWLRLDAEDNERLTFFSAFLAALEQLSPRLCRHTRTLLNNVPDPDQRIRQIMGALLNDWMETGIRPLVIVLDDLQTITDPDVYQGLNYLLENLPSQTHLVVLSRYEPLLALARQRALGRVADLHLEALRFTDEEMRLLLGRNLSLNLSGDELNLLQRRTGGWAAGLRLLALSLQNLTDPTQHSNLIHRLPQFERYIFDFLAEEVLDDQQPDLRQFLLDTSILYELTPALCETVSGRKDSQQLLDDIYRRNLFLTSVSSSASPADGYRYHDLFADFLRQRLQQETSREYIQELHRRAAEASPTSALAVHHYLAGELWEEAVAAIITMGRLQLQQGFVQLPSHWLESLPSDVREGEPWLQLFIAAADIQRGHLTNALPRLERLLPMFSAKDDVDGTIRILLGLSNAYLASGNLEQADVVAKRMTDLATTPFEKICAYVSQLWVAYNRHQWSQVDQAVSQAMEIAQISKERGAVQMLAQSANQDLLLGNVGIERFEQYNMGVLAHFGPEGGVIEAGARLMLSAVYVLRGELQAAREAGLRAKEISSQLGGLGWQDVSIDVVLLMVALAQADYRAVERRVQDALALRAHSAPHLRQQGRYHYAQARSLWLQGRLDELRQFYSQIPDVALPAKDVDLKPVKTIIGSWIARSEEQYASAEESLRAMIPLYDNGYTLLMGYPRLDLASLYLAWKKPEIALKELRPALDHLVKRNLPGIILAEGNNLKPLMELALKERLQPDFVRRNLAVWTEQQRPQSITVPTTGATLTPREVEVLRLLAEGASNQEVASRLVVSERTVKSHVTHILAKLNVSSRTQAVACAHQLHLI
jgi:LuxR family maltose regulon positive regulatory protein